MIEPSKQTIPCAACQRRHQIGTLDAIATHFYVKPWSCTDGDYWLEGEWHFICPSTGVRNRLLFCRSWEEEQHGVDAEAYFKARFRSAFRSMAAEHSDRSVGEQSYKWINNTHVDKNRLAYGLPEWVPAVPGRVRMPT